MEREGLDEEERAVRKREWSKLKCLIELKDKVKVQQARSKWIREGDINSSFFHKCVERKGRSRAVRGLRVNGKWYDGVAEVKEAVDKYFGKLFEERSDVGRLDSTVPMGLLGTRIGVADAPGLRIQIYNRRNKGGGLVLRA